MSVDLAPIAPKLAMIVRMLASDKSGDVAAALDALRRVLTGQGADFHDFAALIERSASGVLKTEQTPRHYGRIPLWQHLTDEERRKWVDVLFENNRFFNEWQIRHLADVSRMLRCGTKIRDRKAQVIDAMLAKFSLETFLAGVKP